MPISRVRRLAEKARIPYSPTAASSRPTAPSAPVTMAATRCGSSTIAVACSQRDHPGPRQRRIDRQHRLLNGGRESLRIAGGPDEKRLRRLPHLRERKVRERRRGFVERGVLGVACDADDGGQAVRGSGMCGRLRCRRARAGAPASRSRRQLVAARSSSDRRKARPWRSGSSQDGEVVRRRRWRSGSTAAAPSALMSSDRASPHERQAAA